MPLCGSAANADKKAISIWREMDGAVANFTLDAAVFNLR
jgi:hypothetical protein